MSSKREQRERRERTDTFIQAVTDEVRVYGIPSAIDRLATVLVGEDASPNIVNALRLVAKMPKDASILVLGGSK